MLNIFFLFCLIDLTYSNQWYSKSQCTQKEFANHMDINCNSNELILIGWSHYGTKKTFNNFNSSLKCQPSETDCIMDYTHKIAELCNGVSKCEVILTQQFIHKCSDEATYLFISYQCIQNSTILDVCSESSITTSNGLNLISPMFPNEYPNNMNCNCLIQSDKQSNVIIDVENLSFNLQDNDKLFSFSGTIPFGISLLTSKISLNLKFQTDETLSQSGFWIRLYAYPSCRYDELTLGSKCLQIFPEKQTWKYAQNKCLALNSNLISIDNIIEEKKLTYFISNHTQQELNSFWIFNEKEKLKKNISWWPWRSSTKPGKCVIHSQDGWIKRPCNEEYAFICERDLNQQALPLTVRCGNIQPTISPSTQIITTTTTIVTTTTMTSTESTTIEPISSTLMNKLEKTNTIDPTILAAILAGISLLIFSINIIICYLCKRRTQISSKCPTSNDTNSSFTHEELQHSLMQHLYHEQTNTISSTSTSSKSNDTSTTVSSNLFQLSSPSTLCFQNSHIHNDHIDYHVYETIPTDNSTYNHSAFKPIIQSNTQMIRPYCPRTNMLVMPVCCHHYSSQCPTGTILPPSTTQIYTRSESIV